MHKQFCDNFNTSPWLPPAATVPGLCQLIKEANVAFGGFWPRAEPWVGRSYVRFHFVYFIYIMRCFLNFSFIILSNYYNLLQIPKALRQRLPAITFNSSEFGVLSYADYWAICMRM